MTAKYRNYSYTAKRMHRNKVLFVAFLVSCAFLIYTVLTAYFVKTFKIQSDTMEPEICRKDRILVVPIYNTASVKRGEAVVTAPAFRIHLNFFERSLNAVCGFLSFQLYRPFDLQRHPSLKYTVRRVVGLPGDTVYMENFILYIKTRDAEHFLTEFELAQDKYNLEIKELPAGWDKSLPLAGSYPKTVLKEGEYFLLCDNGIASDDSRMWGPVNGKSRIYGRILVKYWPFGSFKVYK